MQNTRPFKITPPEERWRPAPAQLSIENSPKLLPPLVAATRNLVHEWRTSGYPGASKTTLALIEYWFETEHRIPGTDNYFQFYFAQREAFESVAYLYEVKQY